MMKLFKRKVAQQPAKQSISEIVKQIHDEFDHAADLFLKQVKEYAENTIVDEESIELARAGFHSVPRAAQAISENRQIMLDSITAETIQYFKQRYPKYKYITESGVTTICEKYGLVLGESNRYKGEVPSKNAQHIIGFKFDMIDEKDRRYIFNSFSRWSATHEISFNEFKESRKWPTEIGHFEMVGSLFICAPNYDMIIYAHEEIQNSRIVSNIPDPVVLAPVRGGYLIITAWGDEASDSEVINEKHN